MSPVASYMQTLLLLRSKGQIHMYARSASLRHPRQVGNFNNIISASHWQCCFPVILMSRPQFDKQIMRAVVGIQVVTLQI
eukprot:scaffold507424_cov26-Prasinocladus_malaysianus.AAC.1